MSWDYMLDPPEDPYPPEPEWEPEPEPDPAAPFGSRRHPCLVPIVKRANDAGREFRFSNVYDGQWTDDEVTEI
jgi:hypothetical protein